MSQDDELLNLIWRDADIAFKELKEDEEKNKPFNSKKDFRRIENNYYVANCKICNINVRLSCKYKGDYPLCQEHRDQNYRAELKSKLQQNKSN
jgi:hypothetical protein